MSYPLSSVFSGFQHQYERTASTDNFQCALTTEKLLLLIDPSGSVLLKQFLRNVCAQSTTQQEVLWLPCATSSFTRGTWQLPSPPVSHGERLDSKGKTKSKWQYLDLQIIRVGTYNPTSMLAFTSSSSPNWRCLESQSPHCTCGK